MYVHGKESNYTTPTIRSALAKMYGCPGPMLHNNLPIRRKKDIEKSRWFAQKNYEADLVKYGVFVELIRLTGMRKAEAQTFTPSCIRRDNKGRMYIFLKGKVNKTKGGRTRSVPILKQNEKRILEIVAGYAPDERLYKPKYRKIQFQAIRRMFAADLYEYFEKEFIEINKVRQVSRKGKLIKVSAVYKSQFGVFDRYALLKVSRALGHNRVGVIIGHYTQFMRPMIKVKNGYRKAK